MDWTTILITAIPVVLGVTIIWNKAEKILTALKILGSAVTHLSISLEDKKLTPEELTMVRKNFNDVMMSFKAIVSK